LPYVKVEIAKGIANVEQKRAVIRGITDVLVKELGRGGSAIPTGPKGQKRPADVIGNAVRIMRIATGEEADDVKDDGKDPAAKALGSKGGKKRKKS
jgi:hypothetical protein